jgi:hypothetical protein
MAGTSPAMTKGDRVFHFDHVLERQVAPYRRHKENRDIDRKAEAPQDRAKRRPIAEIGEDIGNPHDQEQYRELVDQALRAVAEFRQQHGDGEERKRLDAILMRAQCAGTDGIGIEGGVARPGIVETAKPGPFDRRNRQQIEHQRCENAPFGDRHGFPRRCSSISGARFML